MNSYEYIDRDATSRAIMVIKKETSNPVKYKHVDTRIIT